jgi:tRNA(His) guanylyltransferase
MSGSRFAYVRSFELPDPLLPGTFIVFRLDGHTFHRSESESDRTRPTLMFESDSPIGIVS